MKKTLIALTVVMVTNAVLGQGTVFFNNRGGIGIDSKILFSDGQVLRGVSGPEWKADLIAGPAGTPFSQLVPVPGSTTTFRTGAAAGYVNAITVTIPNIGLGAQATVAMRAYNGNTYENSSCFGTSKAITNPTGNPASGFPFDLIGLQGFTVVCIPEPPIHALAVVAALSICVAKRRA
ncbi:MAG: hypothetical protein HYY23_18780 [Verrucomicrobia bacterium]|nr:hypothetical protein [Verrucomicrobiota bacterium]